MKGFRFGSDQGAFYILPNQHGWEASYGNDTLGEFATPEQAADDIARGLTCEHLCDCDDTSTLEIPEKLADWEVIHVDGH